MSSHKKNILVICIIGLSVIGNVFFGLNYFMLSNQVKTLKSQEATIETNTKVINFMSLFIKEVLQSDKEVDFETRLILENSVRELKDTEIKKEWQYFTESKTEAEAQASVKRLLGILVQKIQN